MSELTKYDSLLSNEGPAALVIREPLMAVEGKDGVVFPATFAAGDTFAGGYNIDGSADGNNVCLIDTVGAQANRIEPIFTQEKYAQLVPQIVIKAGEKEINILHAGHRAGDAIVRCSELQEELQSGFKAILKGNAEPLAKVAPTSLVFGVWDSRDTQAKLPRLVSSTIRAFNVRKLTRSAQFNPATEYVNEKILDEPEDEKTRKLYSSRGFIHAPATGSPGGVIAEGGIRRDAVLGLAALRLLRSTDEKKTLTLQRYVLGLSLVSLTANTASYLRQGCLLVLDPEASKEFVEVHGDGKRVPSTITHQDAIAYAQEAAKAFGVGPNRLVNFDKDLAKKDILGEGNSKTKPKKGGKKPEAGDEK